MPLTAHRVPEIRIVLATVPAVTLLLIAFGLPLISFLGLSVQGGSVEWLTKVLTEDLYIRVMGRTFLVALAVTLLTLVIGYPVAHFLATTSPRWRAIGFTFVLLPLYTSVLVRTYAWMVMLGRDGLVNTLLVQTGIADEPLRLLYNISGVLVAMTHVLLPYMILPLFASIARLDPALAKAAEGLGASRLQIFLRIQLPLTIGGVAAGSVLVFILSLGFFITPALLGGGRVTMIAVVIQQQVGELLNWNLGAALSLVLLLSTIGIYATFRRIIARSAVMREEMA